MSDSSNRERSVELLRELGLKAYEAECFVALTRLPHASAKEVSEVSGVPRTRVYDAVKELESMGLVEIQHTNPQRYRAVSIEAAADTIEREYVSRVDTLRRTLRDVEPANTDVSTEVTHEVWALSGTTSISNRASRLVEDATEEVVLVVGREGALTDEFLDSLRAVQEPGVDVVVGAVSDPLRAHVEELLPDAEVFVSGLEWLTTSGLTDDRTEIGRLLMVDRSNILVSSVKRAGEETDEQAVFGRGFDNGLVAIVRRLMATGLLPRGDQSSPAEPGGSTDEE